MPASTGGVKLGDYYYLVSVYGLDAVSKSVAEQERLLDRAAKGADTFGKRLGTAAEKGLAGFDKLARKQRDPKTGLFTGINTDRLRAEYLKVHGITRDEWKKIADEWEKGGRSAGQRAMRAAALELSKLKEAKLGIGKLDAGREVGASPAQLAALKQLRYSPEKSAATKEQLDAFRQMATKENRAARIAQALGNFPGGGGGNNGGSGPGELGGGGMFRGRGRLMLSGGGLRAGFTMASASTLGLAGLGAAGIAGAGLTGTVQGDRLAFAFQQLTRQITSIALPAIDSMTKGIERLVHWLRSLNLQEQDKAFNTVEGFGVGALLGKLLGGFGPWGMAGAAALGGATAFTMSPNKQGDSGYRALDRKMFGDKFADEGYGSFSWFPSFHPNTRGKTREQLKKEADAGRGGQKDRRDVLQSVGGFEGVDSTFRRVQEAAIQYSFPNDGKGATGGQDPVMIIGGKIDDVTKAINRQNDKIGLGP